MPDGAIVGQSAAGDQAVNVGMEDQSLRPGVQHSQYPDRAADPARIAAEIDDRRGGGLHQGAIAIDLMTAPGGPQFLGNGDGDVEIANREHLLPTLFEPSPRLLGVTLRAGAVAAGVEDVQQSAAVIAAPLLSAERFGLAGDDVGDGATMRWQHRRAMDVVVT